MGVKVDFGQCVGLGRTLMTLQGLIPCEVLPKGGEGYLFSLVWGLTTGVSLLGLL